MIGKAGIAAIGTATAIALGGCGVGEAKISERAAEAPVTPLPVETAVPERTDIFAMYQTTSTLDSDADAPVVAKVSGEVVEILVEEGDYVDEGQILARLDGERLRLETLEAKANLEKSAKEYQRLVGLHERGLVSAAMYEGLKFDIDALDATYELKRLDYSYTTIRAPISGVISSRETKVGRQVYTNDPVFRITDTSKLVAHMKIPQTELAKFSTGQVIRLSVDAMPEIMYAATIDRISPTIDMQNGTFRATAYIDNSQGTLAPGMFGRFSIGYERHENALVVPAAAVVEEDTISVVYVVSSGTAVRRVITTGIESNGVVEILSGLKANEVVVVTGQAGLRDGSPVLASNARPNRGSG